MNENGDYIELSDGMKWFPAYDNGKPSPEVIAHSLGNLCRFTGHCKFFYSVAEHCVKCSYLVPAEFALEALLHDSHEIYTNDLSKPVKNVISGTYSQLEGIAEEEIRRQHGLSPHISKTVKHYDIIMVLVEAMDLLPSRGKNWKNFEEYYEEAKAVYDEGSFYRPEGWPPCSKLSSDVSKQGYGAHRWLKRYKELTSESFN